jgi:hypothetical protein
MENNNKRGGQVAAPLYYFYCSCKGCDGALPIVVTFCATCANICCPHLMHEFRCFECWDSGNSCWPIWSVSMLKGPLVDETKIVLAAEVPVWMTDID